MKLLLLSDDGEVLDSIELTLEELRDAQTNGVLAKCVLDQLQAGSNFSESKIEMAEELQEARKSVDAVSL